MKEVPVAQLVREFREQREAIILAHYYTRPEIQDIADIVGDSLALARAAAGTQAKVIAFCGVHFMAETAAILNPGKTVVMPDHNSGCPMSDMCDHRDLAELKREYPEAAVICYVNSSAEVKAMSDICCTSSNAVRVVRSFPVDRPLIFVPDRWLGTWSSRQAGRTNITVLNLNGVVERFAGVGAPVYVWGGFCPTHHHMTTRQLLDAKAADPEALVCVHPECPTDLTEMADYVGSTAGIIKFVKNSPHDRFIIGTEEGILHAISKEAPGKHLMGLTLDSVCYNMKLTNMHKLYWCLRDLRPRVTVEPELADRARSAIEKMLEV